MPWKHKQQRKPVGIIPNRNRTIGDHAWHEASSSSRCPTGEGRGQREETHKDCSNKNQSQFKRHVIPHDFTFTLHCRVSKRTCAFPWLVELDVFANVPQSTYENIPGFGPN